MDMIAIVTVCVSLTACIAMAAYVLYVAIGRTNRKLRILGRNLLSASRTRDLQKSKYYLNIVETGIIKQSSMPWQLSMGGVLLVVQLAKIIEKIISGLRGYAPINALDALQMALIPALILQYVAIKRTRAVEEAWSKIDLRDTSAG